jgi:two-component system sensor histidine kinase BaeS
VDVSVVPIMDLASVHAGIRIRVSDTGNGIPAESLPHIFDRFYRANGDEISDNGHVHGFGLGLAIVREIALTHGGSVGVESELRKGTTFILDLPARPSGPTPNGAKAPM